MINSVLSDLPGTKFIAPQPHQHIVFRQRLIDDLNHAIQTALVTLISAPAGSGKTTLLATFSRQSSSLPTFWFSVDQDDNDPARFVEGLVRAVQADDLDSTPEPRHRIALLINSILEQCSQPFVLILDDLHMITEPSVLSLLDYLFDHLPAQFHLILSVRYEPSLSLARLRARRQLVEIGLDVLALTADETTAFLTQSLNLNQRDVEVYSDIIQRQTNGWAAGIAMLISLTEKLPTDSNHGAFQNMLARSNRFIFEFLAEEILNVQPPDIRAFLLDISILTEITVDACQQLTGRDDAIYLLEKIYRRNLLLTLVSDDQGKVTYRFHDLFVTFLRERLKAERPSRERELHRRAAEISTTLETRLSHWIAAEEWDKAALLVTTEGERLIRQGAINLVRHWITTIPDVVRIQHPLLIYLLGICAAESWDLDLAKNLLKQVIHLLDDQPDRLGAALTNLATVLSTSGEIAAAEQASERALQYPIEPHQRAHLLIARVWQALAIGNPQAVIEGLDEVLTFIEQTGSEQAIRAIAPQYHAQFSCFPGGIELTERFCRLAEHHARHAMDALHAASLAQRAWLYWWRGEWDTAFECANAADEISQRLGILSWIETEVQTLRCIYLGFTGQDVSAGHTFETFFSWLQQPDIFQFSQKWLPLFYSIAGHLYWSQNRQTELDQLLDKMTELGTGWADVETLSGWLHALQLIDRSEFRLAEPILQKAVYVHAQNPDLRLVGDARMWLAYLYLEAGNAQAALINLTPVLEENQHLPGRICYEGSRVAVPLLRLAVRKGVYVAFARKLLTMLVPIHQHDKTIRVPDTGEVLTPREIEVLQLIGQGATNPAIASALTISVHTVKIHVARILAKLAVDSRTAAALRAREFGLTPPE